MIEHRLEGKTMIIGVMNQSGLHGILNAIHDIDTLGELAVIRGTSGLNGF